MGQNANGNLVVAQDNDITYANIAASALVATGKGVFYGFIVNSHTSGTVKVWAQTSAAVPVLLDTITLAAGPTAQYQIPMGIDFTAGLYVTIGGTANITVLYRLG